MYVRKKMISKGVCKIQEMNKGNLYICCTYTTDVTVYRICKGSFYKSVSNTHNARENKHEQFLEENGNAK